ncbi:MAG: sigma-70 family RNA polymerase sigma factor [Thermoproteota archaeon]
MADTTENLQNLLARYKAAKFTENTPPSALRGLKEEIFRLCYPMLIRIVRTSYRKFKKAGTLLSFEDLMQYSVIIFLKIIDHYRTSGNRTSFECYLNFLLTRKLNAVVSRAKNKWTPSAAPYNEKIRDWFPNNSIVSLDDSVVLSDDDQLTFKDILKDESKENNPLAALEAKDKAVLMRKIMSMLKPRHEYVLRRKFFYEETLTEIARKLGVSVERVRQLEERALSRLQKECDLYGLRC